MAFTSLNEVQVWADANGGEFAVRENMARGAWGDIRSIALLNEWVRLQAESRAETERKNAVSEARRATAAAERSAKWTMWAAIVAAGSVVVQTLVSLGWLDWAKHAY